MLILYPATMFHSCISSHSFSSWIPQVKLCTRLLSSNRNVFTSSFPNSMPIYLFLPNYLGQNLQYNLQKWQQKSSLSCFSSQKEIFQCFILMCDVSCIFLQISSIKLRKLPFIPSLLNIFIMRNCWIYVFFPVSFEMIMWFGAFIMLIQWFIFSDFSVIYQICIPGINSTWPLCIILLYIVRFNLLVIC